MRRISPRTGQAIEAAKDDYDAILMDIQMPNVRASALTPGRSGRVSTFATSWREACSRSGNARAPTSNWTMRKAAARAERFDMTASDRFDMQDEIVARVANQLGAEIARAEAGRAGRSANPDSMNHYFLGISYVNNDLTAELLDKARPPAAEYANAAQSTHRLEPV
jgi:hypothetical protein